MIKRNRKIISTIVTTCTVLGMMPTIGASASVKTLDEKDGDINNAISYKDGKYILDGSVSYDEDDDEFKDDGVFYFQNNDNKKTLKETDSDDKDDNEIDSNADATIYGDKYLEFEDGDYYFNFETAKVTDDSIKDDENEDASNALKKKLKKTDRYNKNDESPSLTIVKSNDFMEPWYEYEEEGFHGYTNSDGKYIDADYNMGSIKTIINGSKKTFKNTDDTETIDGKKYKLFVSNPETLGQDDKYIYRKAKLEIKEYDEINSNWVTPTVKVLINAKDDDTNVVVGDKVSGIVISGTNVISTANGTTTLTATVTPDDAENKAVTWSSSNENIATVDSNGVVTAKANGEVTISATAKDGSGIVRTSKVTITGQVNSGASTDTTTTTGSAVTVNTDIALTTATNAVITAENSKLQSDIDTAQTAIDKLQDDTNKTALQDRLDAIDAIDTDTSDTTVTQDMSANSYAVTSNDSTLSQSSMEVIQKISKDQDSKDIDDAKYPSSVTSYELVDSDDKDNVVNLYSTDNISFVDGKIISWKTDGDQVKVQVLTEKTKNGVTYLEEDTSDDEDFDALDVDVDGNLWRLNSGKIYKFDNKDDWNQVYKCDGGMDKLSVYDKNNLVVWSEDDDIYAVANGSSSTDSDSDNTGTDTNGTGGTVTTQIYGWVKNADGTWVYYNTGSIKATGWLNDKGTWYFLDPTGIMKTGWINVSGTWYFLDPTGAMKTGWVNDYGTWYYLDQSGAMKTGWINDNGTWYYLNSNGSMAHDTSINGYYLGSNGAWI